MSIDKFGAGIFALSRMDEGLTDEEIEAKFRDLADSGRLCIGDVPDIAGLPQALGRRGPARTGACQGGDAGERPRDAQCTR